MSSRRQRREHGAHRLSARRRFGGYNHETQNPVRKADVRESEALKRLIEAWKGWRYDPPKEIPGNYLEILPAFRGLAYSREDVESLSIIIDDIHHDERFPDIAGLFLSALMNCGDDSHYLVHTMHLRCVGYKNTKNVIIEGDAGREVGSFMEGGSITVRGDAGDGVGFYMAGGSITVEGNAGKDAGFYMRGGSITIRGDAEEGVGRSMRGGQIWLEGAYGSISPRFKGGRIFHEGKLIVDR